MNSDDQESPSLAPRKKQRVLPKPRIVAGDAIAGMKKLRDASVRLIIADPPFTAEMYDGFKPSEYMNFATLWLRECARLLQPGGTLLFYASPCAIWSSRMNVFLADELGLKHQQSLAWTYGQGGDARLDSMKQYAVRHEILEWWVKTPGVPAFNPSFAAEKYTAEDKKKALQKGIGRVSEASLDKGRPPRTWCDIPRENSRSKERRYGKHSSMKPLSLCERLIEVHSNDGDTVVIPFAGSGSEVLAAGKCGRQVVGFEIKPEYVDLMRARFAGHRLDATFE